MHLRPFVAASMLFASTFPVFAVSRSHRSPTAQRVYAKRFSHTTAKSLGQRSIDDSRASEIQQALVNAGYLSEEPTGHWDSTTQSAMQRYQSDHGWQTKLIPDSRAIIKLGLGPHETGETTAIASTPLP